MEEKWRNWLRDREAEAGGNLIWCTGTGGCWRVEIDQLSREGVFRYAALLKQSIEENTVQHFSPEQVAEIVGTPSPALKGDPYSPEEVAKRSADRKPWMTSEARKEATKIGGELVKEFKGEGVGKSAGISGGHGAPYARAGAELIRRAKDVGDPLLKDAYLKEGKQLIDYAKGISHK